MAQLASSSSYLTPLTVSLLDTEADDLSTEIEDKKRNPTMDHDVADSNRINPQAHKTQNAKRCNSC
jgi:hypothetical protein